MVERYYVYAIAAPDIRLPESVSGFGGPLHILRRGELGAVVSQLSAVDAVGMPPAATTENLLRHETVVEAVRARGPALPVRFGTVLPDGEAVTLALGAQDETLRNDLRRLGDKVELGITALWHPAGTDTGARTLSPDAATGTARANGADATPSDRHPGLAYLHARQAEYRQAESARERAKALARVLDAVLRPHTLDLRRSVCPSERLALRDLYLMERERIGAFKEAFDGVRRQQREVRFLLSGPWPPYSFVTPPARHDPGAQGRVGTDRIERVESHTYGSHA